MEIHFHITIICEHPTVYMVIFAVVLFWRISRVSPRKNFYFNMAIHSNENITKITKLSHREFPHLVQNRENICKRIIWRIQYVILVHCNFNEFFLLLTY